jgi:hypothetical protein
MKQLEKHTQNQETGQDWIFAKIGGAVICSV